MMSRPFRWGLVGPALVLLGALGPIQACGDRSPNPGKPLPRSGGAGGERPSGGQGAFAGSDAGGGSASGGLGGDGAGGSLPLPTCEDQYCRTGSCSEASGFPTCQCSEGFGGSECDDVKECSLGGVCAGAECNEAFGSYFCSCDVTEMLSGETCADLDECEYSPCAPGATCTGAGPGFTCQCASGSFGNGFDCTETDACAGDPCGEGATCVSTSSGAVCQCPLGKAGADCSVTCDSLAGVTDPALITQLEQEFNKYIFDIDPAVDLVGRTNFTVSNSAVRSLDGLECWTNLETLNVAYTSLGFGDEDRDTTPLEALRSFTRLRELDLTCVDEPDLALLAGHPTLEALRLQRGEFCERTARPVADFTPLGTLKSLRELDVTGQPLGEAAALSNLKALSVLTMADAGMNTTVNLAGLKLLRALRLNNNSITDPSGLGSLPLLSDLVLAENELDNVDFVAGMDGLLWLDITSTATKSIQGLPPSLRRLDAANNQLTSLSSIAAAEGLLEVNLTSNKISSLEPLGATPHRGTYRVMANSLDCENEAALIHSLEQNGLELITDCDPLASP